MKRILTFLLLLPFYGSVVGQEFKLLSLEESPIDSLLSTNTKYDLNGNISAIVVLSFQNPISRLACRGNIIEQIVTNERTYILYVADITKMLTIQHEDYYPFVLNFKDNNISIVGGHSYVAKINNPKRKTEKITNTANTTNESKQETGSQFLVFRSDTKLKILTVNGEEWTINKDYNSTYVAKKMVPFGTYQYKAVSDEGKTIIGEAKVSSKLSSKLVKLVF